MKKRTRILLIVAAVAAVLLIAGAVVLHFVQHPMAPNVDKDKKHIACVGDSITYGAGVIGHRGSQSYPACLQALVGEDWQVLNYGISGKTLQAEADQPYTEESFYQKSLDVGADIYLIMLGSNDSKAYNWDAQRYKTELIAFVKSYQAASPNGTIYLMQPPRAFPGDDGVVGHNIEADVIADEICPIVAEVAGETGCEVIDLYSLTQDHPEWYGDGIHPNGAGNQAIADYIFGMIFG